MRLSLTALLAFWLAAAHGVAAGAPEPHPVCVDSVAAKAYFAAFIKDATQEIRSGDMSHEEMLALEKEMRAVQAQIDTAPASAICRRIDALRETYRISRRH